MLLSVRILECHRALETYKGDNFFLNDQFYDLDYLSYAIFWEILIQTTKSEQADRRTDRHAGWKVQTHSHTRRQAHRHTRTRAGRQAGMQARTNARTHAHAHRRHSLVYVNLFIVFMTLNTKNNSLPLFTSISFPVFFPFTFPSFLKRCFIQHVWILVFENN